MSEVSSGEQGFSMPIPQSHLPENYRAIRINEIDGTFHCAVETLSIDQLPPGDVLIQVHYSSLNYKDALSAQGHRGITKNYPHTPGIDAAGVVVSSTVDSVAVGSEVLVIGFDLGMNTAGGLAEYIRVPAHWIIPKPAAMTFRQAMQWGTAGFTAALSVDKLQRNGVKAGQSILVTAAGGGVGSVSALLATKLGYDVTVVTEKPAMAELLTRNGVKDIISRDSILIAAEKPIAKPRWHAAIDAAGGNMLVSIIKQLQPQGSVACCGLVAGTELPLTIYPFILRGINVLGIDSAELPLAEKIFIWQRMASEWALPSLDSITEDIVLDEVPGKLEKLKVGRVAGRVVVKVCG
jgi:alcohol dehydrogenase